MITNYEKGQLVSIDVTKRECINSYYKSGEFSISTVVVTLNKGIK